VALRNEGVKPFRVRAANAILPGKRLKNEKESPRRGAWRLQTLYMTGRICT
jgi:hypothetical protein